MIPKTIHYCWFGGKTLPIEAKKCIESWKRLCPDYEIVRWDERNFDVSCHPFCEAAYKAGAWAFVSDYARLKVVYDNGGVYLDTDVELLKPLDSMLDAKCYIGVQQDGRLCATGLGFASVRFGSVVQKMLLEYDAMEFDKENLSLLACPRYNDKVIRALGYSYKDEVVDMGDFVVYPCRYMDPIAPGDSSEFLLCEDTVSIHHYANSWGSPADILRRKLIRAIGQGRVQSLKKILHRRKD